MIYMTLYEFKRLFIKFYKLHITLLPFQKGISVQNSLRINLNFDCLYFVNSQFEFLNLEFSSLVFEASLLPFFEATKLFKIKTANFLGNITEI